jgi:uncharacterized protein (TIGR03083 family)
MPAGRPGISGASTVAHQSLVGLVTTPPNPSPPCHYQRQHLKHRIASTLTTLLARTQREDIMTVTADDLDAAISSVVATLRPATDRDWSALAGTGEWDSRHTAEHIGDCLISYAGQLVARPTTRYVRFEATADKDASSAEVLEFAATGAGILAATVRTAAPNVRAYHPTGTADPEGFTGMGCVEALVHGEDIARGLGLSLDPPRDLCAHVLARMFPHVSADLTDIDPWTALLWATDRVDLPGREQQTQWRWRGTPLD